MEQQFGEKNHTDYKILENLGKGTYGTVYRAIDKHTNQEVALKKIAIDDELEGIPPTILREISLLQELNHKNIIKLQDILMEEHALYLVFEQAQTDLKQFLDCLDSDEFLDETTIKNLLYQLLLGIQHCHDRFIMHRDLKPQNLLILDDGTLKIADFGLSRQFQNSKLPYTQEVVTIWYRAPEILLQDNEYNEAADIWSVGCILVEMTTKNPLFHGDTEPDQIIRIFRMLGTPTPDVWPNFQNLKGYKATFPKFKRNQIEKVIDNLSLQQSGIDLLYKMLEYDPQKRITAKQALSHPYFFDINII